MKSSSAQWNAGSGDSHPIDQPIDHPPCQLLAGAAFDVFEPRLAHFHLLALGLADREGAAAEVFGFVKFIVRQKSVLRF
jgi:hypothetical protein